MKFEGDLMDTFTSYSPVEEYCKKAGFKLAEKIDEKMAIVVKPKPWWCPNYLYKKIIKETVEIYHQV